MTADRISALLDPFLTHPLSESQLNQISIYIDLLQRWNARINLTAIRNEEEIVTRHFGESLFLARHLFSPIDCHPERSHVIREADGEAESKDPYSTSKLSPAKDPRGPTGNWQPATGNRVLDIGSGAGFPALPLKIWAPEIHLTLIESNHKKSAFLKEVSRALTFTNINVITERAETILTRRDHPQAEVVTLRAVEHFETIPPSRNLPGRKGHPGPPNRNVPTPLPSRSNHPKLAASDPYTQLKYQSVSPRMQARVKIIAVSNHKSGVKRQ
jgi:16S rRNA (guanine527-N7)-methyltransferase